MSDKRTEGRPLAILVIAAVLLTSSGELLSAQEVVDRPAIRAVRISGDSPRVDGSLKEPVWGLAPAASDFVQFDPASSHAVVRYADAFSEGRVHAVGQEPKPPAHVVDGKPVDFLIDEVLASSHQGAKRSVAFEIEQD